MIKLNLIVFIYIIELLLLFIGLSVFYYFKYKSYLEVEAIQEMEMAALHDVLLKLLQQTQKEVEVTNEKMKQNPRMILIKDLQMLMIDHINAIIKVIRSQDLCNLELWDKAFEGFNRVIKEQDGKIALQENDCDTTIHKQKILISLYSEELQKHGKMITNLKGYNVVLMGYKDTVCGILNRFKAIIQLNARVNEHYKSAAEKSKVVYGMLNEFAISAMELEKYVTILDTENNALDKKVKEFDTSLSKRNFTFEGLQ
ncbi:hypothetical protein MBAV_004560 [Candidatus Magnetobacterium bavaricum]|uniref:Uncharacterized protein n=1 Tax=Candidatus Magnetobacterium bavaricum TaxID=29290 RepID=A0A0F3GMU0_9BACT|nr:hypothetical protein MBAV_004560 [Candidatus Magnetobacterium bavaricum]